MQPLKRAKELLSVLHVEAHAVVLDEIGWLVVAAACTEFDPGMCGRPGVLPGIAKQVREGDAEQPFVAGGDEVRCDLGVDRAIRFLAFEFLNDLARELAERHRLAVQILTRDARELQQIVDQIPHALRARAHAGEMLLRLRIEPRRVFFEQQRAETIDSAKRRTQVVRHRVAERLQLLVHRFQLGGAPRNALLELGVEPPQFRLGALLLRDVDGRADGAHRAAFGALSTKDRLRPSRDPPHLAVAAHDPMLDLEEPVAGRIVTAPDGSDYALTLAAEDAVDETLQRHDFVRTKTANLALLRRPVNGIGEVIMVEYPDVRHADRLAEALVALAQGLLGALAFADVDDHTHHPRRLTRVVKGKLSLSGNPVDAAVGPDDTELVAIGASVGHRLRHRAVEPRAVIRMHARVELLVGASKGAGRHSPQLFVATGPENLPRHHIPIKRSDSAGLQRDS